MQKDKNWILYSVVINITGIILSMVIGIINDNGGAAMGYIFVGFAITGVLSVLTLILGFLLNGWQLFKNRSKVLLALILIILSICEISLIRVLALW